MKFAKIVIVHSSTMNPCQYSAAVLKGQGFQENTRYNLLKTLCAEK